MMNFGQAQSAGLGNFVAQRSSIPNNQFVQTVTDFVEKTGVSPIDMLADTYQRVMAAKRAMMRQGLAAGRAEAQQPRTVAEQLNREALALGIGSQPYVYAGGGLVAFTNGGATEEESLAETEEAPLSIADIESANLEDVIAQATNPAAATSGTAPASARTGARPGARPSAGTNTSPSDIAEYTAAAEKAIKAMEGKGRPAPEVLELRKAMLAAQEAEREPRVEYQEPDGVTARELFQLASLDPTKGKWVGSLADKAANVMLAREAKAEQFRKLNREIDIANRKLNTAIAQQRLAYATTDQKAREDADQAVLNATMELRYKVAEMGFKSREVGAKEKGSEAEMVKANVLRDTSGLRADAALAAQQREAIASMKADANYQALQKAVAESTVLLRADPNNPQLIARYQKAQQDFAALQKKYGVIVGETPASATPSGAPVLKFDAQGNRIP